jgi:hypothetical protein
MVFVKIGKMSGIIFAFLTGFGMLLKLKAARRKCLNTCVSVARPKEVL